MKHSLFLAALLLALPIVLKAADLTPSEMKLRMLLGEETPIPILLWPDKPPRFTMNAPAETVTELASIKLVSVPTISVYLPPKGKSTGRAIIICPGGGYAGLDWRTHVVYAAQVFNPLGVAVIGLKYRIRLPNGASRDDIRAIALLDAQRAVRLVRQRAKDWGLDPHQIGVAGYSAGANLAMNLAVNFDAGDAYALDVVDRQSSRPDFVVGLATWHWGQKESPFKFTKDTPPVFLVHSTNDSTAPIEMPRAIKADLEKRGVPVRLEEFSEGGHGVGHLIPQRVLQGFPPSKWPALLLAWLDEIKKPATKPETK